jgi:ATP-binding cassette subfamily F protein uup
VTHDRYFLDRIATRIAELDGGRIWTHEGNYSDYLTARAERQAADAAREDRRQTFLRREIEWVRAGVKARTTKAQSRLKDYHRIASQEGPPEEREMELIIPPASPLGNVIVDAQGIAASGGDRRLFSGLDLKFDAGTCTGIVGRNGAGKSTLLRVLMGLQPPEEGRVTIGRNVVFNYVDQQRLALDGTKSLIEEIGGKSDFIQWGAEKLHIRTYLRRFLFFDDRPGQRVEVLSGGERSRLLLAKILCRGGNFIVLDEPTNDLDLPTLRVLEEAILDFPGCVLVVSHDRWFLDRICDRVVVFENSGNVHIQEGNYSYYLEKNQTRLAAERAALTAANRAAGPAKAAAQKAKARKLTWKGSANSKAWKPPS